VKGEHFPGMHQDISCYFTVACPTIGLIIQLIPSALPSWGPLPNAENPPDPTPFPLTFIVGPISLINFKFKKISRKEAPEKKNKKRISIAHKSLVKRVRKT
jgi:hypothetical protein